MSQCIVPKWNLRQQRQAREEGEEEEERHVHSDHNLSNVVPMYDYAYYMLSYPNSQDSSFSHANAIHILFQPN